MTISLLEREALTVTGFLVIARWDDLPHAVPAAWRRLFARVAELEFPGEEPEYVEVSFLRENGIFRELAGVVTPPRSPVPLGMHQTSIPPNRYLHSAHEGALTGITERFQAIYDHAAAAGIEATDFKLDFGYDEHFSPSRHDLLVGLGPFKTPNLISAAQAFPS